VQVKHVTAVLQDDVQGIGGLLLVGVRDHSKRQPVSALVRSNDVDADVRMTMRVHLRTDLV